MKTLLATLMLILFVAAPAQAIEDIYPANGTLYLDKSGQVLENKRIHGYVSVRANNVTIKNSVILGPDKPPAFTNSTAMVKVTSQYAGGFAMKYTTIRPTYSHWLLDGIHIKVPATVYASDISHTVDGIKIFGNYVTVKSTKIHDLKVFPDAARSDGYTHNDGIQVESGKGIRISGNNITGGRNAALMVTQNVGPVSGLWFNNNYVDGGACSLNYSKGTKYGNFTDMQANYNRFGRNQTFQGCAMIYNKYHTDLVPVGNVWADTGLPAGIKRGA